MSKSKEKLLKELLEENLKLINHALISFQDSLDKCEKIGTKESYSTEELEKFEVLTARFSRITDIYTQKLLKNLFSILREDAVTFIDKANLAEKLGLVESSEQLKAIRDLRNEIAHDYCLFNLNEIFASVLEYSPKLLTYLYGLEKYLKLNKLISS